jgi:hypothetical protein
MSRKPIRKKNPTNKQYSLKVFENYSDRRYGKNKFLTGSAFMLLLAGFVMYQSLTSQSNVLGANTTNLIAQERSGAARVEKARETQQKMMEQYKARTQNASVEGMPRVNENESKIVKCPVGERETKELSIEECRRILERRRLEMMQNQEIRVGTQMKTEERNRQEPTERRPEMLPKPPVDEESEESNEIRTKIELEGDRMRVKTGSSSGSEVTRDLTRGEQEMVKTGLMIEGKTVREENGKKIIEGGQFRAHTDLPISVNVSTNQLVVTTSAGDREVTVLPEQAIENLNAQGIVGSIEDSESIEVVEEEGAPVYKIEGTQQKRLFGVLPLQFKSRYSVSAVDGSIRQESSSFVNSILRALSL